MIYKWQLDLLNKYSFIDKAETKNSYLYIHYTSEGVKKFKKIHVRANLARIQDLLLDVRKEVGVTPYGTSQKDFIIV